MPPTNEADTASTDCEDEMAEMLQLICDAQLEQYCTKAKATKTAAERLLKMADAAREAGDDFEDVAEDPCTCDPSILRHKISFSLHQSPSPKLFFTLHHCPSCSFLSADTRSGSRQTIKTSLKVVVEISHPSHLDLLVFKSETTSLDIPQLGFEMTEGSLGASFLTIGNLLEGIVQDLSKGGAFVVGEGTSTEKKDNLNSWMESFDRAISVSAPWTAVFKDPLGAIFVEQPADVWAKWVQGRGHENPTPPSVVIGPYTDENPTIPPNNFPSDFEASEEFLNKDAAFWGCVLGEASVPMSQGKNRALFLTRPTKKDTCIGYMFGSYTDENNHSSRLVQLRHLSMRMMDTYFLDGSPYSSCTYINDPTLGAAPALEKRANCYLVENHLLSLHQPNYLTVHVSEDIDASPESPVELWLEYNEKPQKAESS